MTTSPSPSVTATMPAANEELFARSRLRFTAVVSCLTWALLLWRHFHGGVPSHHVLHRRDLPAISCWFDAAVVPALSWVLVSRLRTRFALAGEAVAGKPGYPTSVLVGFAWGLVLGVLIAALFTANQETSISYLVDGVLVAGLLVPIYRAESVLGFVLGMTFTFGSILPTVFASFLAVAGLVLFRCARPVFVRVGNRFRASA